MSLARKAVLLTLTLAVLAGFISLQPVFGQNDSSIKTVSGQATAYLNLAHNALNQGQLTRAMQLINMAHTIAPDDDRIQEKFEIIQQTARQEANQLLFEGQRLFKLGDYKQASRLYKQALQLFPDDPRIQEQLQFALSEGKLKRIRHGLSTVKPAKLEQEVKEGGKGETSGSSGGPPAIATQERTIAPSRATVADTFQQGMRYLRLKDWFKAMQKFEEVLKLDPSHEKARRKLFELEVTAQTRDPYANGREAFALKKYESALGNFREVEKVQPDFLDTAYFIGQCLETLGDIKQAISYYERFLQKNPEHTRCRIKLAYQYYQDGQSRASLKQMVLVKHLNESLFHDNLYGLFTWLYVTTYWYVFLLLTVEAVFLITMVLYILAFIRPLGEGEPYRLLRKAVSLYHMQKLDKAAELLRRTIVLKPNYLEAHFALGLVFSRMKRLPQAVERLKTVLFLDPKNQVARYNLAIIYNAMRRHDQALIELRSIISTSILRSIINIDFKQIKQDVQMYTFVFEKLKELAQQKIVSQKQMPDAALSTKILDGLPAG